MSFKESVDQGWKFLANCGLASRDQLHRAISDLETRGLFQVTKRRRTSLHTGGSTIQRHKIDMRQNIQAAKHLHFSHIFLELNLQTIENSHWQAIAPFL